MNTISTVAILTGTTPFASVFMTSCSWFDIEIGTESSFYHCLLLFLMHGQVARCGRGRDRLITTALLITGCNGQLNSEGIRQAHQLKDVPFTRGIDLTLDLTDPFTVRDTGGRRPDDPPQHRRRLPRRWDGPLRAG